MFSPADFLEAAQWTAIATGVLAAFTGLCFVLQWGIRFRFVGVTGFMIVVTVGLFGLSVVPIVRETIPGAARYTTVYDSGATQVVIAVSDTIDEPTLEATLKQAAVNLFTPGRLGAGNNVPTIRARAMVHPEKGVSELVYLGQVQRSPNRDAAERFEITVFPTALDHLAELKSASAAS